MEFDKNEINIEKYIQGELSGDALKEFEAQIEQDKALQKEVNFYQYTDAVLETNLAPKKDTLIVGNEFKRNLDKLSNKYFQEKAINEFKPTTEVAQEESNAKPTIIKRLLPFATLAAAAALLLFLFLPNKDNKLYKNFFMPEKLISLQSPTGNLTDFDKAINRYESKNYKDAIPLFDKALIENPSSPWIFVYKGCSEMELNQIDEAMHTFQQLAAQNSDFTDKANWYLALCYLKKGDKLQTINLLKRISPDDKKYEKAQQLMKEL